MQATAQNNAAPLQLPTVIKNNETEVTYIKGKLLGKGGFAHVFEVKEIPSNKLYADKIISKDLAKRKSSQEKIRREIFLHRKLTHPNVVRFIDTFDDHDSIHIILEYCSMKSLLHLMKGQKVLREEEVQFYLKQICEGVRYIHQRGIVHRDLKLGNMFLTASHVVKIGDFGLATTVNTTISGNGTSSLCGTPNYIAPEVLQKKGHGFEADIWAIGCMTFAMMSGSPPFETKSLSTTYAKIAANSYILPSQVSEEAKSLITQLLHPEPKSRGNLNMPNRPDHIVNHKFFFVNFQKTADMNVDSSPNSSQRISPTNQNIGYRLKEKLSQIFGRESKEVEDKFVETLIQKIESLLNTNAVPSVVMNKYAKGNVIVSKWIDYSNKYGFGYQLSDGTTGVLFNDKFKICENKRKTILEVIDEKGCFHVCNNKQNVPTKFVHYAKLLEHFVRYMEDNLADGWDASLSASDHDNNKLTQVLNWTRNKICVIMLLSNGSLQINFFHNHVKLLFWHSQGQFYVTLIGQDLTLMLSPICDSQKHHSIPSNIGSTLKSCSLELQMFNWEISRFSSLSE